ncbi:class I SAM-dependent methyltransferase [Crocosphaera sp. XPORK-15E]|uniref:class I SAM-dependent methyltransferase n=1 Tax=Crocosphaera sp. XPORK-15E TaxID=3110247 RepID=UPI002B20DA20|nr:class I SAM-dependent methyltransferase [Crocosphaera sp. XPORK-15E]MEA5535172.1 class I SAM-dependent methyltransferase [Crocosphaera sp. XPORK-15E]
MKDLKEQLKDWYSKDLGERSTWYSPAAEAYNKVRPRYPQKLIDRVVELTQITSNTRILEIGCGPGIATVPFAKLGCSILCLEPNLDFCKLAQKNCKSYPNVIIKNTSFEEWKLEPKTFDIVLGASSFHWIPPEIVYTKAFASLKDDGYLLLLWNKELQPDYEVYQNLANIYQKDDPSLKRYEDRETQENILKQLGEMSIDSGKFENVITEIFNTEVNYSIDDYLLLLNTYSPYLQLEKQLKNDLFLDLKKILEKTCGEKIKLSYLSSFHLNKKKF